MDNINIMIVLCVKHLAIKDDNTLLRVDTVCSPTNCTVNNNPMSRVPATCFGLYKVIILCLLDDDLVEVETCSRNIRYK
jgi:hypothetical protein